MTVEIPIKTPKISKYLVSILGRNYTADTRDDAIQLFRALKRHAHSGVDTLTIWAREGRKHSWLIDPDTMVEADKEIL